MRVLHVPYSFYPDPAGGTEVYVDSLARCQRSLGYNPAVAAPGEQTRYDHAGTPVWRFPVSPNPGLRELYGGHDEVAARAFGQILDDFSPDLVHLHAITSAISVGLVEEAKKKGLPVILSYHTPTMSCPRGTLRLWGSAVCNGKLEHRTCTACTLHGLGLSQPVATVVARLPGGVARGIAHANLSGGKWTALRMPELIDLRIRAFHRLMQTVERVIAHCNWTRELLVQNGVAENRITLCRQGISWESNESAPRRAPSRLPLKTAFFGRFDSTKGLDVVVRALKSDPALPVHLDLFGIRQGEAGDRYSTDLQKLIAGDPRIRVLPPLPSGEVIPRSRDYDLVVVPSQLLETGPLVVLEAFASRTPVIGSNLGGIAELVNHGVDGLLVDDFSAPAAWANSLRQACFSPDLLASLRLGIRPPRHARDSALEMMPVYAAAVGKGAHISAGA